MSLYFLLLILPLIVNGKSYPTFEITKFGYVGSVRIGSSPVIVTHQGQAFWKLNSLTIFTTSSHGLALFVKNLYLNCQDGFVRLNSSNAIFSNPLCNEISAKSKHYIEKDRNQVTVTFQSMNRKANSSLEIIVTPIDRSCQALASGGHFNCSSYCISSNLVCDGYQNCPDSNLDELDCPNRVLKGFDEKTDSQQNFNDLF